MEIPDLDALKVAANSKWSDAIPFKDLRTKAKALHEKQKVVCKDYSNKNFDVKTVPEAEARMNRAEACQEARREVRVVFKKAVGMVKAALKVVEKEKNDPRIPLLKKIQKTLEDSEEQHTNEVGQAIKARLEGYKRINDIHTKSPEVQKMLKAHYEELKKIRPDS